MTKEKRIIKEIEETAIQPKKKYKRSKEKIKYDGLIQISNS